MKKILSIIIFILTFALILSGCNKDNNKSKVTDNSKELFAISNSSNGFKNIKQSKWGFIDKTGKIIVNPIYDSVHNSSEGLAVVLIKNKYGYVDYNGELVIKNKFQLATDFKNGLARVYVDFKGGIINKNGDYILKPTYNSIGNFSDGLASISKNSKYGFINTNGKIVIKPTLIAVQDFGDGMSLVTLQNHQYTFIDKKGDNIFKQNFDKAFSFQENLADVNINNKWGFINTKGDLVIKPQFKFINGPFSSGFVIVQNGTLPNPQYEYINKKGNHIFQPNLKYANPFSNGLALASIDGINYEYINAKEMSPIDKIYKTFKIDKIKVIINSSKFKVSLDTTNVKIYETVKFNLIGVKQTAKMNSAKVLTVEKYDNTLNGNYDTGNDNISIKNYKTANNQIKSYIFIEPGDEEKIYEYDFTLKIAP
ncbi:WG repeat-containing protein [Clostridium psychrophilum]|uniref:WG repeat-containing protein n=1 Tax=Clostridium psychrophilum TaxID=132926 RepID=UPI001C0CE8AB|nr:WG repeat-containing protein [Clostridium psychrophilum]MBU3181733.1 WG repeat-containing protein [Clostridium psychrophilum]